MKQDRAYQQSVNKFIFLIAVVLIAHFQGYSQNDYQSFYDQSLATQNTGMYILGGWAIANIATGAYGWSQYSDQKMYFHQMNLFWNTVNLSIAGFALYSNAQVDFSMMSSEEILGKHLDTERILLINSALDIGYIGTGFLLRHYSGKSEERSDLLKGYGNSLILQGGFLLVFDLVLYQVLRTQRLDYIDSINLVSSAEMTGIQFVVNF
jgi:hypothetical protein